MTWNEYTFIPVGSEPGGNAWSDSLFGKAGITKCGFSGGLQRSERVL